jgi:hypothetical protein
MAHRPLLAAEFGDFSCVFHMNTTCMDQPDQPELQAVDDQENPWLHLGRLWNFASLL